MVQGSTFKGSEVGGSAGSSSGFSVQVSDVRIDGVDTWHPKPTRISKPLNPEFLNLEPSRDGVPSRSLERIVD